VGCVGGGGGGWGGGVGEGGGGVDVVVSGRVCMVVCFVLCV